MRIVDWILSILVFLAHFASSMSTPANSGGDQYIHNQKESTVRQSILNLCFRHTTHNAFALSGLQGLAEAQPHTRLLEIGCGSGYSTIDTARQFKTVHITAVDTNPEMIAAARRNLQAPEHSDVQSRIEFCVQNGETVMPNQFDAVWMRFVVVHVPDPELLVQAAVRALKPNGILLVEDTNVSGCVNDPPFFANELLHKTHIPASLRLGGDVRRGPFIGRYMSTAGLSRIRCNTFSPLFARGISLEPWCPTASRMKLDTEAHFDLGVQLVRMSLESLAPKILEFGLVTQDDLDRAWESVRRVEEGPDYQLFSIPGGQIFQWWGRKDPTLRGFP